MTEVARGDHHFATVKSTDLYQGRVLALRSDVVAMPGGGTAIREVMEHPGAVAVVALDEREQVVLIHQYRHPLGTRLWELPAGLLDRLDEPASECAARELAEEAGLSAARWSVLVDTAASPGFSDEVVRVFLAEGLSEVDSLSDTGDEEADLVVRRVPLTRAVEMVLAGEIINSACVAGVLAAHVHRVSGLPARPAEADWPSRPRRFRSR